MTNEQQKQLFEAIQGAMDRYKKVGESFKQDNQAEAEENLQAFFTSFQELFSVYESVTANEADGIEGVEKSDTSIWRSLFEGME